MRGRRHPRVPQEVFRPCYSKRSRTADGPKSYPELVPSSLLLWRAESSLSPLAGDFDLDLNGHLLEDILPCPDHRRLRPLGDLGGLFLGALDYELIVDGVYETGVEPMDLLADVDEGQLGDVGRRVMDDDAIRSKSTRFAV